MARQNHLTFFACKPSSVPAFNKFKITQELRWKPNTILSRKYTCYCNLTKPQSQQFSGIFIICESLHIYLCKTNKIIFLCEQNLSACLCNNELALYCDDSFTFLLWYTFQYNNVYRFCQQNSAFVYISPLRSVCQQLWNTQALLSWHVHPNFIHFHTYESWHRFYFVGCPNTSNPR